MAASTNRLNLTVVAKNVVNVYREPSSSAEMVSQVLMGQPAWVLENSDEWARVKTWDNYSGWMLRKWLIDRPDFLEYGAASRVHTVRELIANIYEQPDSTSDIITKVVVSTGLEIQDQCEDWVVVTLPNGKIGYLENNRACIAEQEVLMPPNRESMISTAKRFIGIPYLWGGTSPFGLDCSGFIQLVYKIHGISLPRDAWMQAEDSRARPIEKDDLLPADIIFFAGSDDKNKITHVGMWIGKGRFIHSTGGEGVVISQINEQRYSSIYNCARRIIC